ncbi:MAG: hypothetical protein ACRC5C_02140 [Bacilli bacterium]
MIFPERWIRRLFLVCALGLIFHYTMPYVMKVITATAQPVAVNGKPSIHTETPLISNIEAQKLVREKMTVKRPLFITAKLKHDEKGWKYTVRVRESKRFESFWVVDAKTKEVFKTGEYWH